MATQARMAEPLNLSPRYEQQPRQNATNRDTAGGGRARALGFRAYALSVDSADSGCPEGDP